MNQYEKTIDNCMDCAEHHVQPDPDQHDWFCSDDEKVVCGILGKNITVACRPYRKRHECAIPGWCPKLQNNTEVNNGSKDKV